MRVYYSAILDALGFYVERADGSDVFVQELPPDGYLLAFLVGEDDVAAILEAGVAVPIARVESEEEASIVQDRLGQLGVGCTIVSDAVFVTPANVA